MDAHSAPAATPPASEAEAEGPVMTAVTTLLWGYPAAFYFAGVATWSWLWIAGVLVLDAKQDVTRESTGRTPGIPSAAILRVVATGVATAGPLLFGVVCLLLTEGGRGVARVFDAQLKAAHSPVLWLLLVLPFCVHAASLVATHWFDAELTEVAPDELELVALDWNVVVAELVRGAQQTLAALPHAAGAAISVAVGWWGFLLPHMLHGGNSPLRSALLLGFLLALWALPQHWVLLGVDASKGVHGPMTAALLSLAAVPLAVFVTRLYLAAKGSMLLSVAALAAWEASGSAFASHLREPVQPAQRLAFAAWTAVFANALLALPALGPLWREGSARLERARRKREGAAGGGGKEDDHTR